MTEPTESRLIRLEKPHISDMLAVNIAYTTTTDINLVAVPCIMYGLSIDIVTISAGVSLSVKLIDATSGDSAAVRWVIHARTTGLRDIPLPAKGILFDVGIRAFLDQTTGIGRIGVSYVVL